MTRWFLTHLPVRVGEDRRPRWVVEEVFFDWDRGILDCLRLRGGWSWPALPFGPGVEIRDREVWIPEPGLVVRESRRRFQQAREQDWDGWPVTDADGHVLGRVRDVEFKEKDGTIRAVWISRGVIADVWRGMWLADFGQLRPCDRRIALV